MKNRQRKQWYLRIHKRLGSLTIMKSSIKKNLFATQSLYRNSPRNHPNRRLCEQLSHGHIAWRLYKRSGATLRNTTYYDLGSKG